MEALLAGKKLKFLFPAQAGFSYIKLNDKGDLMEFYPVFGKTTDDIVEREVAHPVLRGHDYIVKEGEVNNGQ